VDQTYYNSTSGSIYLFGQPVNRIETNTRGGSSWVDKETYTYNDVRLPIARITYTGTSGTNKTEETRWTYDTNWNITTEKSVKYNASEFLGNTYTYDSSGRYLATLTNALSQTITYSNYDPYGNAKTIKDHKNRTTTYNYDEWGRKTSTVHPEGVTETTVFAWGGTGLFTKTNTTIGTPSTSAHYNAFGREIRTGNQRFDGQWQYVDTEYNVQGQVSRISLPFKGTSATQWNTYTYDSYDRPTKLTEASGKISTWSFSGLSTTETKNGIAITKTVDASGALVNISDPGGNITYSLRPDRQLSTITAHGNIVTSFEYDAFGRQTAIVDPSAGRQTIAYSYATAGVLTLTETNPKGQIYLYLTSTVASQTSSARGVYNHICI
jgi:YD repeat-containing protein